MLARHANVHREIEEGEWAPASRREELLSAPKGQSGEQGRDQPASGKGAPRRRRSPLPPRAQNASGGVLGARNHSKAPRKRPSEATGKEDRWRSTIVEPREHTPPIARDGPGSAAACRQLGGRLRAAPSAAHVFAALSEHWPSLDCLNLATALTRLAQLAEAAPEGPAAHSAATLLGRPAWCWLLDQVVSAAAAPEFGPQCVADVTAALCRLDALSPALVGALRTPLARALAGDDSCGGDGGEHARQASPRGSALPSRALVQLLWCFGAEDSLRPLFLAIKPQLLQALWSAARGLDAQGVSTAWWALGQLSARLPLEQLYLAVEAPTLLPRLAQATPATADGMGLQVLSQVMVAFTKLQPPYHDEPLLQQLADVAACRVRGGDEQPSPGAASLICLAFGRLAFLPRCTWCAHGGTSAHVLDDLGAALAPRLHQAQPQASRGPCRRCRPTLHACSGALAAVRPASRSCACWSSLLLKQPRKAMALPQEVCDFMSGLALLGHAPSPAVLHSLLLHLAGGSGGAPPAPSGSPRRESGERGARGGGGRLMLEGFSCQQLADLVAMLRVLLRSASAGPPSPPAALAAFFDSLDTVLRVRLAMATSLNPSSLPADLALTAGQLGAICSELGHMAGVPGAALTAETLRELEGHIQRAASAYSGASLASVLHLFAAQGHQPLPQTAAAASERLLAVLDVPALHQHGGTHQGLRLGIITQLLWAVSALGLPHVRLLRVLLATACAVLGELRRSVRNVGGPPAGLLRELVCTAGALRQLHAAGVLERAGLAGPDAVLPLWRAVVGWIHDVAHNPSQPAASANELAPADVEVVRLAAHQLNIGLAVGDDVFWLPAVVQRGVPARRQHR